MSKHQGLAWSTCGGISGAVCALWLCLGLGCASSPTVEYSEVNIVKPTLVVRTNVRALLDSDPAWVINALVGSESDDVFVAGYPEDQLDKAIDVLGRVAEANGYKGVCIILRNGKRSGRGEWEWVIFCKRAMTKRMRTAVRECITRSQYPVIVTVRSDEEDQRVSGIVARGSCEPVDLRE